MFAFLGKELGAPTGNKIYDFCKSYTEGVTDQYVFLGMLNPYLYLNAFSSISRLFGGGTAAGTKLALQGTTAGTRLVLQEAAAETGNALQGVTAGELARQAARGNTYTTGTAVSTVLAIESAAQKTLLLPDNGGGTDVLDEIKRIDEIKVEFNYNSKYDETEFARQLADQQKGMNELTVQEYLDNRQKYIEQGRAIESNAAQQAAREKAFVDKVDELQDAGLSLKEAEEQAQKWLDTQAALHNPDQVAGGHASNVGGVGDKDVNSSIGSQWRYRIDDVDAQIQKMSESMSEAERNSTYLNVNLIYKGD